MKKLIIFAGVILASLYCKGGLDSLKWDKFVSPNTLYTAISLDQGNQLKYINQYFINANDTLRIDLVFSDCSAPASGYVWDSLLTIPSSIIYPYYCIEVRLILDSNSIINNCFIHDRLILTLFMDCTAPLSISEINRSKNSIQINPNPVKDHFNIEISDNQKANTICVYNLFGIQIRKEKYLGDFDASELAVGIYLIAVQTDDGVLCGKFLKE